MISKLGEPTYKIIRFYKNSSRREVIRRGLSLADARIWCSRDDTRDPKGKWFDGFVQE